MIYLSAGLPGRFGDWCAHAVARLIDRAFGAVEILHAESLEDFAVVTMQATAPYVLISTRQPAGRLRAAMAGTERRLVVALEDPRRALADVVASGMEFTEAVRYVARSCASLSACGEMTSALVVDATTERRAPVEIVGAIAAHLGVALDPGDIVRIVEGLAEDGMAPPAPGADGWWSTLDEEHRAQATGALDFYAAATGRSAAPIVWERGLFTIQEERPVPSYSPAIRPADITGRPRCLIYGPYITLPPGSWSAAIALGFSREAAEIPYLVEIVADRQLAAARIEPGAGHFREVHLDFTIEAVDQWLQVRIHNERAAFDGQVALGHVTVVPQGHIRGQTLDYFAAALSDDGGPAEAADG
jgi:hypothetical protein